MSRYLPLRVILFVICGLALAACAGRQTVVVRPEPSPELLLIPSATLGSADKPTRAAASVTPGQPQATPTPEAFLEIVSPSPQPAHPFSLGVPAGDAYDLAGLAVDVEGRRAYIYAARSSLGGPAIAIVDLHDGKTLKLVSLPGAGQGGSGQVLLSPDGRQGYVVDRGEAVLTLFDPGAGALGPTVAGVTEALLSPDGERLYAIMGDEGLRAFATRDLWAGRAVPVWSVTSAPYAALAASGDALAATRGGAQPALVTFDSATGRETGSFPLADVAAGLAPGPDGGWLISLGYSPARLVRLDAGLKVVAEVDALSGVDPYFDAPRGRYLIVDWVPDGSGRQVLIAYSEDTLTATTLRQGTRAALPDVFAPYEDDILLGLRRHDGARLSFLDAANLSSTRDVILGVKLADMTIDEVEQRLFVADDQDRIHLLSLPGGEVQAVWDGTAPIALDSTNRRLYVNRADGVVALDSATGEEIARFPQKGMPAPDPNRNLVYIVDAGVTIYDRAGAQIGRLESTFPVERGMNPNPYAFAARVNPVSGVLVTTFNNGSPGSGNRSYLTLYPPQADRPITITGPFTFVSDLAFDPSGYLLVSYSNAFNMEALQRLDNTGRELARLGGRTGKLALDPATGLLYVVGGGALARVDAGALELRDLYRAPSDVSQVLLHSGLQRIYLRNEESSRITVVNLDHLESPDMHPIPVAGLPPDADIVELNLLEAGGEAILYATTLNGDHFRSPLPSSTAGLELRWERVPVGSLPAWGRLTVANDVLFCAGSGEYGGDGVFRSRDGGESWELLSAGLTDLRPAQPVLARNADEAYFVGRTGGVFAWRAGAGSTHGHWDRILPAETDYQTPGELSLAPDGALYLTSWDRLRRSIDGGRTWDVLPLPGEGLKIAGFDPEYALTRTLFSILCGSDRCQVLRSRDGGETQQAVLSLPSYSSPLKLVARAGRSELYLFSSGYPAVQLFRSLDGGDSWQAADPDALRGATSMAIGPDGRLWFGSKGAPSVVDSGAVPWSPVPAPQVEPPETARTPITPSPSPRLSPPPLAIAPTPCASGLPELGCPVSGETPVSMARQPLQHGRMIWIGAAASLPDLQNSVLVLPEGGAIQSQGRWERFADTWQEDQPASDPLLAPPIGLFQPMRGFGKVWRERLGGPEALVGWATAPEQGLSGLVQRYQHGWVLRLGGEQVVLADAGTWRGD